MNILIIEDEKRNYNRLKRLLEEIDYTMHVDGPTASIAETVDYLQNSPAPDLILADIRLTDGLSFEAFNRVPLRSPVIFTTAYDEYAIRAFKYNGIDYLLKPVDGEELAAAIDRAKRMQSVAGNDSNSLRQLLEQMHRSRFRYRERFLLPWRDGYKQVLVRDVNHVYSENKVTHLHLNDGTTATVPMSMDALESQLNPDEFFRANRQYIIHIDSVEYVGNYFNAKLIVRLKRYPSAEVVVSRDKASAFKAWLDR